MADELSSLPTEILSHILSLVLTTSPLKEGVRLRTLSHLFDRQVMAIYIDLRVLDAHLRPASLHHQIMSHPWLYRYVKAQISAGKPESIPLSHLRGAARLLKSIPDYQPSEQFQGRRLQLQRDSPPINIEFGDRSSRVDALVAFTVVRCMYGRRYERRDRYIREEEQPTAVGWALLTAVLVRDSAGIARLLEQNPIKVDLDEALILATEERDPNIVRLLLNSGADAIAASTLSSVSALEVASADGDMEMALFMLKSERPLGRGGREHDRAISIAISRLGSALSSGSGSVDQYANIFQTLLPLAQPYDRDLFHYQVAITAIRSRAKDALLIVLERGCDVNYIPVRLLCKPSLLVEAARRGHAEIVQLLLDHGARPASGDAAARDADAVYNACIEGRPDVLRVLLTVAFPSVHDYGHALAAGHLLRTAIDLRHDPDIRESKFLSVLQVFCDHGFDITAANFRRKILRLAYGLRYRAVEDYVLSLPANWARGE